MHTIMKLYLQLILYFSYWYADAHEASQSNGAITLEYVVDAVLPFLQVYQTPSCLYAIDCTMV